MRLSISIHAPRVGCDVVGVQDKAIVGISIHAPRVGCDNGAALSASISLTFQSTHPVWGATKNLQGKALDAEISIHAPRVGCDLDGLDIHCAVIDISIHAPRVGCDGVSINVNT